MQFLNRLKQSLQEMEMKPREYDIEKESDLTALGPTIFFINFQSEKTKTKTMKLNKSSYAEEYKCTLVVLSHQYPGTKLSSS